jgi:GH18 family chitinase
MPRQWSHTSVGCKLSLGFLFFGEYIADNVSGFMAYDLHGAFDSTVKTLAPTVRGQADIREITNDTLPLWYDGLDPQKINFGVAWYGRGYTLAGE